MRGLAACAIRNLARLQIRVKDETVYSISCDAAQLESVDEKRHYAANLDIILLPFAQHTTKDAKSATERASSVAFTGYHSHFHLISIRLDYGLQVASEAMG